MEYKKAVLVAGGKSSVKLIKKYTRDSYIVAIDRGAEVLIDNDIFIDLYIGDFDSIDEKYKKSIFSSKSEIIKANEEKDETDTELAVMEILKRNFDEIIILSGTGTRIDHTLGNINLLSIIDNNKIKGKIIDENNEIMMVSDRIKIKKDEEFPYFSIIAFGGHAENIQIRGSKYESSCLNLKPESVIGISNQILKDYVEIKIKKGKILVIKSKD